MSDRGVVCGTRRRRSISESGHPSANCTVLDSDLVFDEHDLVNKFKILKIKISAWQSVINYELPTIDGIKTNHTQLKGEILSLHQESIYAHASLKLSYDIIELISVIAQIKGAGLRLIQNQEGVNETGLRN